MIMPLFEVAIIEMPTKRQMEDGIIEKLLSGPEPIIAKDEQSAGIIAISTNKDMDIDIQRAKVLVRPFGY